MARKKAKKTQQTGKKKAKATFVVVSAKNYGAKLKGTQIHWEGKRPSGLRDDGTISFGKNILEALRAQFLKFRWIITEDTNSISVSYGITRVRTARNLLNKMSSEQIARNRDIKTDIIRRYFAVHFPAHFTAPPTATYVPGSLSSTLSPTIIPRLTSKDKEAINAFLPDYAAAESVATIGTLKASAEIKSLKELAADLERQIAVEHPESWWQDYIKSNILLIQQGYIESIEKVNSAIGITKFPDFLLVTHDSYIDVMEIKKPSTNILKEDKSRDNYFFDPEVSKAVIQTENYLHQVATHGNDLRTFLKDRRGLDIRVIRPRGIVLAGSSSQFTNTKQRDDFRLLSQGCKNLTIITYDELLDRLKNYITVLEKAGTSPKGSGNSAKVKKVTKTKD